MKYQIATVASVAIALFAEKANAIQCKALVMSGGANRGAWEVGVMWGLAHYGNPSDYYWDVISGISAGAINTAGTAGWTPEEVLEMTEYLSDAWNGLFTEDIWKLRPLPGALNVFNEESLLDDSAALETIRDIMSVKSEFGRRVTASALDIGSGEFVQWNQTNTNYYDFGQAGLSSGSIPVAFPPQHFKNHVLCDGGTVWNVNIDSAINQCRDMGATNEEITIDIVVDAYQNPPQGDVSSTLGNYLTARNIKQYYYHFGIDSGIEAEMMAAVGVNFRYYFQNHNMTCSPGELVFDGDATWCMQESGRRDAQNALAIGQQNIQNSMKIWQADKALQKAYPYVYDYIKAMHLK